MSLLIDIHFFRIFHFFSDKLAEDRGLILLVIARAEPCKAVTHVIMLPEQAGWQPEKSRLLLFTSPTEPPETESVRTQPHGLCPHYTLCLISNSSRYLLGVQVT